MTSWFWIAPFAAPVIAYYNNGKNFQSAAVVFAISTSLFSIGHIAGKDEAESKQRKEFSSHCNCNERTGFCQCQFPTWRPEPEDRPSDGCGKFCGE